MINPVYCMCVQLYYTTVNDLDMLYSLNVLWTKLLVDFMVLKKSLSQKLANYMYVAIYACMEGSLSMYCS